MGEQNAADEPTGSGSGAGPGAGPGSGPGSDVGQTISFRSDESLPLLVQLLDQYLAELQAGQTPDRERLLAEHPELASQLEQCLAGLEFVHRAAKPGATAPAQLGDFRITREIGRGGMGVVYEAEQLSLKRRVALKVLRFGAVADREAMQRFQREAETVAHLHHTNIVPIFAIGSAEDVHYYAMQFIEGHSLADIGRRAAESKTPIPAPQVAQWGLQAAEALSHAHQRGVIHRDVKPSNLIVDDEGRLWLTDFGLAKRLDDVTLSVAGVLLGTPRYMSPEQASSVTRPVDHRTDIYSLGATLYELATGRPIFDAGTPHGVISQILHSEPPRPRTVRPSLPRDLETVILRCLAKEPAQRYATAQELADDLRAFLEERPIRARRPRLLERGVRWVRKHRRTASVAGVSVAASLLLVMGLLLGQRLYRQSQLGQVVLSTKGPRLLAELIDDTKTMARVPVPTPEAVELPAGAYGLRLSASGLLSETWPLDVERGGTERHAVYLDDRFLWPPLQLAPFVIPEVLPLAGGADVILLQQTDPPSLRRLRGETTEAVWEDDFLLSRDNVPEGRSPEEWVRLLFADFQDPRPTLVDPPPDLDGDDVADLLVVSRDSPSLLAISGADGQLLWWFRSRRLLPPETDLATLRAHSPHGGAIVGQPAVEDLDGDGVADFVACVVNRRAEGWIEAVSGRTGESLWFFTVPPGSVAFPSGSVQARNASRWSPQLGDLDGRRIVVALLGTSIVGVDATTGEPLWPPESLVGDVAGAPSVADFDGDGRSELLLPIVPSASTDQIGLAAGNHSLRLVLRSLPTHTPLWEKAFFPAPHQTVERSGRSWHTVADLDGDGRSEVVIPNGLGVSFSHPANWAGVEVLDGVSGETLWQRVLWSNFAGDPPTFDSLLVGPDLDGDGAREVFAAAKGRHAREGYRVIVVALSGADGRTVWRWAQPISEAVGSSSSQHEPLALWQPGEEGWPLLLVPVTSDSGGQSTTYVLDSASGELVHVLADAVQPRTADLDGDGLAELLDTRWETAATQTVARLFAIRGRTPRSWKRLGRWQPAADFDLDGSTDLLQPDYESLTVRSGSDGRVLWQTRSQGERVFLCPPLPHGDLNGDGTPDLLRFEATTERLDDPEPSGVVGRSYNTVAALSGKDGRRLWISGDIGISSSSSGIGGGGGWSYELPLLDWIDLDGGAPEILAAFGTDGSHAELAVLSGDDGRLLWKTSIAEGAMGTQPDPYRRDAPDLDGDGTGDLVLWVPRRIDGQPSRDEVRAISGRSGEAIWSASPAELAGWEPDAAAPRLLWPRPAVGDVDGDGRADAVVAFQRDALGEDDNCHLVVIDGRTGRAQWSWSWRGHQGILPPLLVDFDGDGRRSVCLGIRQWSSPSAGEVTSGDRPAVVIFDPEGQPVERRVLDGAPGRLPIAVWDRGDLDGDGREELLYYADDQLHAYRGSGDSYLWRWRLPDQPTEPGYTSLAAQLVAMRPAAARPSGKTGAAEIVIWAGRRVYGLDGSSGQPRWRCDVRWSPGTGFSSPPVVELLATGHTAELPGVLCHWRQYVSDHWSTVVAQAWPTGADGRYAPPSPHPRPYAPVSEEPVTGVPLPWLSFNPDVGKRLLYSAALPVGLPALFALIIPLLLVRWTIRGSSWIGGTLLLGFAMLSMLGPFPHALASLIALAVPAVLLHRAVRQRSWRTAVVAAVDVLAVLAPVAWYHRTNVSRLADLHRWQHWWWLDEGLAEPLLVSLVTLPGVVFWWYAGRWIIRRRWIRLGIATAVSALVAAAIAAVFLASDSRVAGPAGHYSWTGWYVIWFWGTFAVGLVLLVAQAVRWLSSRVSR